MEELHNIFFVIKITESEMNNAHIFVLREDGNIIRLKASGFYNESSKNRSLIKEFNFYELSYFTSNENNKYINFGKLKNGTKLFENDFKEIKYINIFNDISKILITFTKVNELMFSSLLLLSKNIKIKSSIISICLVIINILFSQENYKFEFTKCVNCSKKINISGFSLKNGGLLCRGCDLNHNFDLETKTIMNLIKLFILKEKISLKTLNINFSSMEEKKIIDMYYNFGIDILGWNLSFLKEL